jgi:hypothetical protein
MNGAGDAYAAAINKQTEALYLSADANEQAALAEKIRADAKKNFVEDENAITAAIEKGTAALIEQQKARAALAAEKKWQEEQLQFWNDLQRAGEDAFMALFESGRSFADRLTSFFKNTLLEFFKQLALRPFMVSVGMAMGVPGAAQAAGNMGAGIGGGMNLLGPLNTLTGGSAAFSGAGMMQGIGLAVENGIMSGFGANMTLIADSFASGAFGTALGAAMPYIGIALAAIALIKQMQKPSLPRAALSFGGGAYEDNVSVSGAFGTIGFDDARTQYFSGELGKQLLDIINGALGAVATTLDESQIEAITAKLQNYNWSQLGGTDILQNDIPEILQEVFGVVFEDISGPWLQKIKEFNGTTEEFIALIGEYVAYTGLMKELTAGAVVNWEELVAAATPKSDMEQYQALSGTFSTMISEADGSIESLSTLTQGLATFKAATVAMIMAIDQAAAAMHDMFMTTADSIRMSMMTEEERYAFLENRADQNLAALENETDPAKIKELADKINADINAAWGLLSEEQRSILGDEYLARINSLDQRVADKMRALREVVIEDADTVMEDLAAKLGEIATTMNTAATTQNTAANTQLTAANTPVQVEVTVTGGGSGAIVTTTGD